MPSAAEITLAAMFMTQAQQVGLTTDEGAAKKRAAQTHAEALEINAKDGSCTAFQDIDIHPDTIRTDRDGNIVSARASVLRFFWCRKDNVMVIQPGGYGPKPGMISNTLDGPLFTPDPIPEPDTSA